MNRIRDILTCFGPVPVVLSVFWTAACLSAKPVERTEPRYQDTEYLMRQTRLSNDKNERQLYTSDRDRGYSAASYQELNRRIPQEQSANVRQVVTAVQQQEQREIQSVALRYIKKVKDAMTQENVEAQLRQRYESVNQVIDLQRQVNNNRIDVQQAEIRKIEESPEFRTARNMGIEALSNEQQQEYTRQLTRYNTAQQEMSRLQANAASYDRAGSYVQGVTTVLSAVDKYDELKKKRDEYLADVTAQTRRQGDGAYQLPEERAAELRRDMDYAASIVSEAAGALTQINKDARERAQAGAESADADIRRILTEFRSNPQAYSADEQGKTEQLMDRLREWDDNKNLQTVTENVGRGLEFTQDVIDKINKAEAIIDTGQKFLSDSERDRQRIEGMEYVPESMQDGMKKYSDMRNMLNAAAGYLPEGVAQETARTGVQVMDTMVQAANFGNQIEQSKVQGGSMTASGEALLKDKNFGEATGGLIAREGEDGRWVIPDGSGSGSGVELTPEEYGRLQDTLSAYTTITGQNPDQEKLAALAASVQNGRMVEIERVRVNEDGSVEREITNMNSNMLLDPTARDSAEYIRDRYNQTEGYFDDVLANATEFEGKKFGDLDVRKQSELSEARSRMQAMLEATGRDPNRLTPTIMTSILNQEAEIRKNRGNTDPLTDSSNLNDIVSNDQVRANFTGFERNMIDSLMNQINDPNTPPDKRAELEYILVSELNRIRAISASQEVNPVKPTAPGTGGTDTGGVPGTGGDNTGLTNVPPQDGTTPLEEPPQDDDGTGGTSEPVTPQDIGAEIFMGLLDAQTDEEKNALIRAWMQALADKGNETSGTNIEGDLRQQEDETNAAQSGADGIPSPGLTFPEGGYSGWLDSLTDQQIQDMINEFESVQQSSQALMGDRQLALDQQQRFWDDEIWTQQQNLDDNLINLIRISESVRNQAQWDRENGWGAWIQDLITSSVGSMATGFGSGFGGRIGSNIMEQAYQDEFCDDNCDKPSGGTTSKPPTTTKPPSSTSRTCSIGPDNNKDGKCDICGGSMIQNRRVRFF